MFMIDATIDDYEVRGIDDGVAKGSGKPFKSIRLESLAGRTVEVSCTNSEFFPAINRLEKGDLITCMVRAVAGRERSYVTLISAPEVKGNTYRG